MWLLWPRITDLLALLLLTVPVAVLRESSFSWSWSQLLRYVLSPAQPVPNCLFLLQSVNKCSNVTYGTTSSFFFISFNLSVSPPSPSIAHFHFFLPTSFKHFLGGEVNVNQVSLLLPAGTRKAKLVSVISRRIEFTVKHMGRTQCCTF